MTHPTTPQSLLGPASSFVSSVELLVANVSKVEVWGLAFLASQATEIILKAYLISSGYSDNDLKKIGHSLVTAWQHSHSNGLAIPEDPPRWCELLDLAHDYPFLVRYPPTNTGIVLPNLNDMAVELRDLYEIVRRSI